MQHGHELGHAPCMYLSMLHFRANAAWPCPCCMSESLLNFHVHSSTPSSYCKSRPKSILNVQVQVHSASPSHCCNFRVHTASIDPCCMSMSILHVHDHAACPCSCIWCMSKSISMLHSHVHAASPCPICVSISMLQSTSMLKPMSMLHV
jgi:hypothetical protein